MAIDTYSAGCAHHHIISRDDSRSGWNQIKRRKKWNYQTVDSENPILVQTGAVLLAVCRVSGQIYGVV